MWETMRGRATFVLDRSLMHQWDTKPDIIAEVSTSEAATADPEDTDTSAFVSRPSPLDVLAAPAGRRGRGARTKKARSASARKPGVDTESEESEESEESRTASDDDEDDDPFGKPCCRQAWQAFKKCSDCPFFAKHKVCKFYHADAPAGHHWAESLLNKKSDKKLNKLGAFTADGDDRRESSRVSTSQPTHDRTPSCRRTIFPSTPSLLTRPRCECWSSTWQPRRTTLWSRLRVYHWTAPPGRRDCWVTQVRAPLPAASIWKQHSGNAPDDTVKSPSGVVTGPRSAGRLCDVPSGVRTRPRHTSPALSRCWC